MLANTWYLPLYWTTVGSLIPAMLWVASDFGEISVPLELQEKREGSAAADPGERESAYWVSAGRASARFVAAVPPIVVSVDR